MPAVITSPLYGRSAKRLKSPQGLSTSFLKIKTICLRRSSPWQVERGPCVGADLRQQRSAASRRGPHRASAGRLPQGQGGLILKPHGACRAPVPQGRLRDHRQDGEQKGFATRRAPGEAGHHGAV